MQRQLDFLEQWFNGLNKFKLNITISYIVGHLTIEYCPLHVKTFALAVTKGHCFFVSFWGFFGGIILRTSFVSCHLCLNTGI